MEKVEGLQSQGISIKLMHIGACLGCLEDWSIKIQYVYSWFIMWFCL